MKRTIILCLLALSFIFIFFIYYQRIETYSFGDEWTNWIAAFFMIKGRTLYSQIFYNHEMLIVYISWLIQKAFHPQNLYRLVFYHRTFVIFFSLAMDILLILRFRFVGAAAAILFELTKYYLFGNLFLSESLIVQPTVYLFGLTLYKISKRKMGILDFIAAAIFSWFIIFMREPFIPLAVFLYFIFLLGKLERNHFISLILFFLLSFLTLLPIFPSLNDYIFMTITFNSIILIPYDQGANGINPIESFLYPLYIFFQGKMNAFRQFLIAVDVAFIIAIARFINITKKLKDFSVIVITLGIAAIRFVPPGTLFYEAFHMLPWYGLFLFSTFYLLFRLNKEKVNKIQISLFAFLCIIALLPSSPLWNKINKQEQFTINYLNYNQIGQTIHILSKPSDTLFADEWDYIIHYEAGLDSSYKRAIYSFATNGYPPYRKERLEMFDKTPPTFYYTYCPKGVYGSELLPKNVEHLYIQLQKNGKPSCLYMMRKKLGELDQYQKSAINNYGFSLPK